MGLTYLAITGAVAGMAAVELGGSSSAYRSYLDATSPSDAVEFFNEAERRQSSGRTLLMTAAAAWAVGAVDAVIREFHHTKRMKRVRPMGAAR